MEAERAIVKTRCVYLMQDKVGQVFDAKISGIEEFGVFVSLDKPFVEGLVRFSLMDDDYYVFDRKKRMLFGRKHKRVFRVGDRMRVRLDKVDVDRGFIDFALEVDK